MNLKKSASLTMMVWYVLAFIIVAFFIFPSSCKCDYQTPNTKKDSTDAPLSWNIRFEPGTSEAARNKSVENVSRFIRDFYEHYEDSTGQNAGFILHPVAVCPCDTLLYSINFEHNIAGVGGSATTPVSGRVPKGNGDYVGVATISENIQINESPQIEFRDREQNYNEKAIIRIGQGTIDATLVDSSKIFAIIDSGIDTALFTNDVNKLVWTDKPQSATLFNFLPYQPKGDFSDETPQKHGSAVAAIAIASMKNPLKTYPRIMILKALDKYNRGSIFSISCALSYAIQKNATVINASLGYYGEPDSILMHYVRQANTHSPAVQLFASAGNATGTHVDSNLCRTAPASTLGSSGLFYPACFSFENITSVTQLSAPGTACFYQNYSDSLVSLGVYNTLQCCFLGVAFKQGNIRFYEGSSFANPAASGTKMRTMIETGNTGAINTKWSTLIKLASGATVDGSYIEYPNN